MAAPKTSPVVAITGGEDFLRHREVLSTITSQQKAGWTIEHVNAAIPGALEGALGTLGCFFDEAKILVVVANPEKAKVETLQEHLDSGESSMVILLDYEGEPKANTKIGKFILSLGKWNRNFPTPDKDYKKRDGAIRFCRDEARRLGKMMDEPIATQMVDRLGQDLGFLSFEILKVVILAEAEKQENITIEMVRGAMAPLNTTETIVIADALMTRSPAQLTLALRRVRKSFKEDPTIGVSQALGGFALNWLETVALRDSGKTPDDIVMILGKNDWYVKNKLLPPLQKWRVPDLLKLIQVLSQAQQTQRNGAISPWLFFSARLLEVCRLSR